MNPANTTILKTEIYERGGVRVNPAGFYVFPPLFFMDGNMGVQNNDRAKRNILYKTDV